jgi:hypothetical protein
MLTTCPRFIHIKEAHEEGGEYRAVPLLTDKKIAELNGIYAHTPYPVSLKLLNCSNVKEMESNYCNWLHEDDAKNKICDQKPEYVFFYIACDTVEYLLAFVKYSDYESEKDKILNEFYSVAAFLGITTNTRCYIFQHQRPPVYDTSIIHRQHSEINKNKKPHFSFFIESFPMKKKRYLLYVNGGYPYFEFKVQDVGPSFIPG